MATRSHEWLAAPVTVSPGPLWMLLCQRRMSRCCSRRRRILWERLSLVRGSYGSGQGFYQISISYSVMLLWCGQFTESAWNKCPIPCPHRHLFWARTWNISLKLPMNFALLGMSLTAVAVAIILVPNSVVKSSLLLWKYGTSRFHLRVPDLQMNCSDLT